MSKKWIDDPNEPEASFQATVMNPAKQGSNLNPVTFVLHGDLKAAQQLVPNAASQLKQMRRDNSNLNLPIYTRATRVDVSEDNDIVRNANIRCISNFGQERVDIRVPPLEIVKEPEKPEKVVETLIEYPVVSFTLYSEPLPEGYPNPADGVVGNYICKSIAWDETWLQERGVDEPLVADPISTTGHLPPKFVTTTDDGSKKVSLEILELKCIGHRYLVDDPYVYSDSETQESYRESDGATVPPPEYADDLNCKIEFGSEFGLHWYSDTIYDEDYSFVNTITGETIDSCHTHGYSKTECYEVPCTETAWSPAPLVDFPWNAPMKAEFYVADGGYCITGETVTGSTFNLEDTRIVQDAADYGYEDGSHSIIMYTEYFYVVDWYTRTTPPDPDQLVYGCNIYRPDLGVTNYYSTHGVSDLYTNLDWHLARPWWWLMSGAYLFWKDVAYEDWDTRYERHYEPGKEFPKDEATGTEDWYADCYWEMKIVVDGVTIPFEFDGMTQFPRYYWVEDSKCEIFDFNGIPLFVYSVTMNRCLDYYTSGWGGGTYEYFQVFGSYFLGSHFTRVSEPTRRLAYGSGSWAVGFWDLNEVTIDKSYVARNTFWAAKARETTIIKMTSESPVEG